ncbi:MAG: N-acetylmuramoyl-L-alanine amidase [Thiotrichales bacterium]
MGHSSNESDRRIFLQRITQLFAATALAGTPALAAAAQLQQVRGVRTEESNGVLRVVFPLSGALEHRLFQLSSPHRVVLDLMHTKMAEGVKLALAPNGLVQKMRHGIRDGDDLRIVFETRTKVAPRSYLRLQGKERQLVLELMEHMPPTRQKPVMTLSDRQPTRQRDLIVAIDAGHGGKDPGATGKKGTKEKQVVLEISRRVANRINRLPGYKAVLVRDRDVYLPLRDRMNKARQARADLFLSIHADASPNLKARGSSVYILSENGASSEAARMLAEKENAVDQLIGGINLENRDKNVVQTLLDLSQRYTLETSSAVADDILSQLGRLGQVHSNKVEKASFVVLKSPDIPSVLVETAFISNPREEARLKTRDHQEKIARSIVKGVQNYFYENAPADTYVAQLRSQEHIIRSGDTLSGIASRYRVRLSDLRAANGLETDRLRIGQKLKIPMRSDT